MEYFKVFEDITRKSLEAEQAIVDRLPDQMSGNLGSVNPGDFLAYKYPNLYYIECKSCTQPVFDIKSHISESQWLILLRKARLEFPGVYVGYLLWFTESHKVFWISAKNMKIIYGKPHTDGGNFGDDMNKFLWPSLFGDDIFQRRDNIEQKDKKKY